MLLAISFQPDIKLKSFHFFFIASKAGSFSNHQGVGAPDLWGLSRLSRTKKPSPMMHLFKRMWRVNGSWNWTKFHVLHRGHSLFSFGR
jgi:hypothetical protein